jgi:hypothetical protein
MCCLLRIVEGARYYDGGLYKKILRPLLEFTVWTTKGIHVQEKIADLKNNEEHT